MKAAANLGLKILPSNIQIAMELDKVAQETEGPKRIERLIEMRTEALKILKALSAFCPILIGSVWRGTIRRGSDIDIEAYHEEPNDIVEILEDEGLTIQKTECVNILENGKTGNSFHIHAESWGKNSIEIVVRTIDEAKRKRTCDTFGDEIKGLTAKQLEKLLKHNPSQQFLPLKRA